MIFNIYILIFNFDVLLDASIVTCIPEIVNIRVKSKWNKYRRNQENFTIGKRLNEHLFNELIDAFAEYYQDRSAVLNSKVDFYNNISYTIKEEDHFVDVRLCVGEVVNVLEEDETEKSYAIIRVFSLTNVQKNYMHL